MNTKLRVLVLTGWFSLVVVGIPAQDTGPRVALVIGNGKYQYNTVLKNPANDAADMAAALKLAGFEVILRTDAGLDTLNKAVRDFGTRLKETRGVGLFYYSGHGVQVAGENYLIPVDQDIADADEVAYKAMKADAVLAKMNSAGNSLNLIFLDACRNNPFPGASKSGDRGLAQVSLTVPESIIIYATDPGKTAADGEGRNSPFTRALLKSIPSPGVDITVLMKRVTAEVQKATQNAQSPWFTAGKLTKDFAFFPGKGAGSSSIATSENTWGEAEVSPGTLTVTLATGGTVTFNGKAKVLPAGATQTISGVAPGDYTVKVEYTDGRAESRSVRISSGTTVMAGFTYKPAAAAVSPASVPVTPTAQRVAGTRLAIQTGFNSWPRSMAASPDGRYLLFCDGNRTGVWEVAAGHEFRSHPVGSYDSLTLCSPAGDTYFLSDNWGSHLYSLVTGNEVVGDLKPDQVIFSAAYSPDGRLLAISPQGLSPLTLYDTATGRTAGVIKGVGDAKMLRFSADGRRLFTVRDDALWQVWDTTTFKKLDSQPLPAVKRSWRWENKAAYLDDNTMVIPSEKGIALWNPGTPTPKWTFSGFTDDVGFLVTTSDGRGILVASGKSLYRFNSASGAVEWQVKTPSTLDAGSFLARDDALVTADVWGDILVISAATGANTRELTGWARTINGLDFAPDGTGLWVDTNYYNSVLWTLSPMKPVKTLSGVGWRSGSSLSSQGDAYLAKGNDKAVTLRRFSDGAVLQTLGESQASRWSISPDGTRCLTAVTGDKSVVKLWSSETGQVLWQKELTYFQAYRFHPRRNTLLAVVAAEGGNGGDRVVELDLATGALVKTVLAKAWGERYGFSPDGRMVASVVNNEVYLYDLDTGKPRWNRTATKRESSLSMCALAWSDDSSSLFVGDRMGTLQRLDPTTGKTLQTYLGVNAECTVLDVSPDGRTLASAGSDGVVRLWDVATGRERCAGFSVNTGDWIAWSPEGWFNASPWAMKNLAYLVKDQGTLELGSNLEAYVRENL